MSKLKLVKREEIISGYLTDVYYLEINGKFNSNWKYGIPEDFNEEEELKNDYFILYKIFDGKKYIENQCIIDKEGKEKIISHIDDGFLYLIPNSCIYERNNNYYNIETEEKYCYSSKIMISENFLFLENRDDENKKRRGIMKINKKDGRTLEIIN